MTLHENVDFVSVCAAQNYTREQKNVPLLLSVDHLAPVSHKHSTNNRRQIPKINDHYQNFGIIDSKPIHSPHVCVFAFKANLITFRFHRKNHFEQTNGPLLKLKNHHPIIDRITKLVDLTGKINL